MVVVLKDTPFVIPEARLQSTVLLCLNRHRTCMDNSVSTRTYSYESPIKQKRLLRTLGTLGSMNKTPKTFKFEEYEHGHLCAGKRRPWRFFYTKDRDASDLA